MVCFVDRIVIYILSENCKDYSVFAKLIHSLLLSFQVYSLSQTNPCALHLPDSLVSWLPVELANGKAPDVMIMKVFGTSPISAFHLQHYSSFWYELSPMTPTLIGFLYLSLYVLSFSTPRELTASYYCYLRVPHHPYTVPDLSMSFKCYLTGNLIIWTILSEFVYFQDIDL